MKALVGPMESHVVVSSQACLLPVDETQTSFNVALRNHGSFKNSPGVLAIIVSQEGTSCQIIDDARSFTGQKLYFNNGGQKSSFVASRLSVNRLKRNDSNVGKMTEAEKQANMLFVIQIPLIRRGRRKKYVPFVDPHAAQRYASGAVNPFAVKAENEACEDMEDAIIGVGAREGDFEELKGLPIERDFSFPIRVTVQYYKATSSATITEDTVKKVANQLLEKNVVADFAGSLVLSTNTGRPTDYDTNPKEGLFRPMWWNVWWSANGPYFEKKHISRDVAEEFLFSTDRFWKRGMAESDQMMREELDLIMENSRFPQKNSYANAKRWSDGSIAY